MEMTVVIAAVAMFVALGLPAIHALINSFQTEAGTRAMISAALSSARALAAKEQRYAGIRFQKAYNLANPLKAPQYMVFIVHDFDRTGLVSGFRAADGSEPMKLPDTVGAMDLRYRPDLLAAGDGFIDIKDGDTELSNASVLTDTTTFSIIFSPSGKMVIHEVQTRNKHGKGDFVSYGPSTDDVFNKKAEVDAGVAMFYQDDYPALGLNNEPSRNSFIIYDRVKFKDAYKSGRAWSDYLHTLERIYINPYTGTIINR